MARPHVSTFHVSCDVPKDPKAPLRVDVEPLTLRSYSECREAEVLGLDRASR